MNTSIADFACPAASLQYLKVPITAVVNGVSVDPETDVVELACIPPGTAPVSGDWVVGSWETISSRFYARALIGPGSSLELDAGLYNVYVRISDNPETPVLAAGLLEITP